MPKIPSHLPPTFNLDIEARLDGTVNAVCLSLGENNKYIIHGDLCVWASRRLLKALRDANSVALVFDKTMEGHVYDYLYDIQQDSGVTNGDAGKKRLARVIDTKCGKVNWDDYSLPVLSQELIEYAVGDIKGLH